MKKVYLANGLFSEADFLYNEKIIEVLELLGYDYYAPQRNMAINDKNAYASSLEIYKGDNNEMYDCDILVAVIDGVEIDSGVAAEIGRFANMCEENPERSIIGIYTDSRLLGTSNETKIEALKEDSSENQFMYRNLYVIGAIKRNGLLIHSYKELPEALLLSEE